MTLGMNHAQFPDPDGVAPSPLFEPKIYSPKMAHKKHAEIDSEIANLLRINQPPHSNNPVEFRNPFCSTPSESGVFLCLSLGLRKASP